MCPGAVVWLVCRLRHQHHYAVVATREGADARHVDKPQHRAIIEAVQKNLVLFKQTTDVHELYGAVALTRLNDGEMDRVPNKPRSVRGEKHFAGFADFLAHLPLTASLASRAS